MAFLIWVLILVAFAIIVGRFIAFGDGEDDE